MKDSFKPTSDERLLAALANGAVILPMWGLILSALIWITQREKSEYVRRQGGQALAWQISLIGIMFLGMICYAGSFFLMMGGIFMFGNPDMGPPPAFFVPFLTMGCMSLAMLTFIVVGLWAAVRTFSGRDFQYPIIGVKVDQFLNE